ncbi:glycerophosphodiester phosphodiesterase family protein [Roseibium album]|uniref:glycerophosphodiester phosphodiesterase n=1 Tax=Roseibium album TaxID=311410 RepID=A0A0M7AKT4_9HYPH|nr:glycerophosphodiester phosphodiesterase family protein [Roseibium album]CTQ61852.1 glycerophosphodiester phosphodiesterase [Roseibium album]CTQ75161.1 glycerophosphodiester phosphodiesterase [Roseibium album]CTQ78678.1 glycerophosphodiester phosphodiesterase [Roseibium album]
MRHLTIVFATFLIAFPTALHADTIELGPRPAWLVSQMADSDLKDKLKSCIGQPTKRTLFSISHRGAPLQFPEHTEEGYRAGALMGAGILECDVTFTKDKELVCRHSQNDLHTTTNVLATDLAANCTAAFTPASGGNPASAECRTSDLTLDEFKSLRGKMDSADKTAQSAEDYLNGTAPWRTELYGLTGTLLTHAESIALFKDLGVKFTPELKAPKVAMPYEGFTQSDYAQKLIDDYKAAGIPAEDVFPQSFNLQDVRYWVENEPEFGKQAVYLDGRRDLNPMDPSTFSPSMAELKEMGVNYLAPPLFVLLALEDGKIVPSPYAKAAKAAGLDLITWTLERSGPLDAGGGWYYQTIGDVIDGDGRMLEVVDVLAKDVGVMGIFSDWPATTSFYASCMGLP